MSEISKLLLDWYDTNKRELPWRDDPSPYHVWISEIMLQQTRVEAVKGYYTRFLEYLPDIRALAEADEDTCLKLWEGLGYYSRVRNLQKAARQIVENYGGDMPRTSSQLRTLPGIGPYTSAAIASIAFQEKVPAVDGNLLRIFSRLTLYDADIKTPAALREADAFYRNIMPEDRPGEFNQALMDLGAMICTPRETASCTVCPLQERCPAFAADCRERFPVMPEKNVRRIEKRTVLVIRDDEYILIRKRPGKGLLAGMYEFPNENGWLTGEESIARARSYGIEPLRIRPLPPAKHIFTHIEWHMHGFEIRAAGDSARRQPECSCSDGPERGPDGTFMITLEELQNDYAIPSAYMAYMPAEARKQHGKPEFT